MVEALRQAGWSVHNPLSIEDALQSLTGVKAKEIFTTGASDVNPENFYDKVLASEANKNRLLIAKTFQNKTGDTLNGNFEYTMSKYIRKEPVNVFIDPKHQGGFADFTALQKKEHCG